MLGKLNVQSSTSNNNYSHSGNNNNNNNNSNNTNNNYNFNSSIAETKLTNPYANYNYNAIYNNLKNNIIKSATATQTTTITTGTNGIAKTVNSYTRKEGNFLNKTNTPSSTHEMIASFQQLGTVKYNPKPKTSEQRTTRDKSQPRLPTSSEQNGFNSLDTPNKRDSSPTQVLIAHYFKIGRRIGNGNFGELRFGKNLYTNENVAIKFEKTSARPQLLWLENKFYSSLSPHEGIPSIHYYGQYTKYNVLVMELLGASLEDLFNLCSRKFSLKTVCLIAVQVLQRIEYVHSKNIVYRDIKPENFLIGRQSMNKSHLIYIIDFGLGKEFISADTGKHIPYNDNKSLTGTARYMSLNTHNGIEQSRRDDLESIGFMLLYFLKGVLPWQGLRADNLKDRYRLIGETKRKTKIEDLCANQPEQFYQYFKYVRNLQFSEKPNYAKLIKSFEDLIKERGWVKTNWEFDWLDKVKQSNKPSNTSSN